MPNDGHGKGTFTPDSGDTDQHYYEIESWVRAGSYPDRETEIETRELPEVDFMVVKVWRAGNEQDVSYDTVWGPFDDWDFLEGYLEYDFGEKGSLFAFGNLADTGYTSTEK